MQVEISVGVRIGAGLKMWDFKTNYCDAGISTGLQLKLKVNVPRLITINDNESSIKAGLNIVLRRIKSKRDKIRIKYRNYKESGNQRWKKEG